MARLVGFLQAGIASAAFIASIFLTAAAYAQQGCCEGGSATGANAWTAGNNWKTWVADTPVFNPSAPAPGSWPVSAESEAGLKDNTPAPYWWTHGDIEIGGRDFVNDPRVSGSISGNTSTGGYVHLGQQSLAKYYEYSIVAPGAFGGGHIATGSNDGLYQLDLWANNVGSNFAGFSDQSYLLETSKAGEHYFSFAWDQTPHIYSTSAQTPFLGVGTDNLTLPTGLVTKPLTGSSYAGIVPYLHPIDLGIERDTASFAYRWTPAEAWDFNADYSHMDRTGTQAGGVVELNGFNPTQVPAPVNDTTQNFGANGEYLGKNLWGQYTFKAAYSGSIYTDNLSSFTVQNPFFPTLGSCTAASTTVNPVTHVITNTAGTANCVAAQMSTPPSNEANSVTATGTADLPLNTRYVGTVSYTSMTQNVPFLDMTNNPLATAAPGAYAGYNWNQVNFGFTNPLLTNRATSLNGEIDTLLSNNTLTTRITPDLTAKLSYRYYDFNNQTPQIIFPSWVSYDGTGFKAPLAAGNPGGGTENAVASLSPAYVKQNAGAELNWRPDREWNFNAAYGYERYEYSDADVTATSQNSAKLSADWRPNSWFDARLSGYFSARRYENYNYDELVAVNQFPTNLATVGGITYIPNSNFEYSPAYRQFMYDNRDETKLTFLTNIVVFPGVTISPSVKYQDDNYGINPIYNLGVDDNSSVSWGVDVVYVPHPDLSLSLSYYEEFYNTKTYATTCQPNGAHGACGASNPSALPTPANLVVTNDKELVNTVTAAMSYVVIPNKLTFDLRASVSDGIDSQSLTNCTSGCPLPNNTTLFEHAEASLTYKFDPELLAATGFRDTKLKLRYAWERNAVANWQNDSLAPFTSTVAAGALWMAYDNPNYNVQAISASLIVKW
ncbi:MAG: MtrB/PioB family decaheme-associated outer membrane protein [Rhodomicrobium sp.]